TQRKCIDANIRVEPEVKDLWNPNHWLMQTTQFLDNIIHTIDSILVPIKQAQTYTVYACFGGIAIQYFKTIGTKWTCGYNGVPGADIRNALEKGECETHYEGDELKGTCPGITNGETKGKYEECLQSTIDTLDFQTKTINFACDRIFCPAVPTLDKHATTYSDLVVKSSGIVRSGNAVGVTTGRGNAGTKCTAGNYQSTDCRNEFQRAWGLVVLLDKPIAPFANEHELAVSIETKDLFRKTDFFESLGRIDQGFGNLCSDQEPQNDIVKSTGRKAPDGTEYAFRIYHENVVISGSDEESTTRLDYGRLATKTTLEAVSKNSDQLKPINSEYSFEPIESNIKFTADGYCSEEDSRCAQAVTGLSNPSSLKVKLPADVRAAIGGQYNKNVVFDPTSGIISASRAVCLPAVRGYLQSYRAILNHVNSCFKKIVETGTGSSDACNSLLSQVVCDFVVDAISCGIKTLGGNWGSRTGGVGSTINPFAAVSQAGESISETITGRYGETQTFDTLFNQNALIHGVCIGALTNDWDLEGIADLVTEASIPPVKSTCVAVPTSSRRFITSNPLKQGKPTYIYHGVGMLAAGSDISRLSMQLVCSNDFSCNRYSTESNPNGECDCKRLGKEVTLNVVTDRFNVKRGDVFDEGEYISVPDGEYRYDKLRLQYSYKDNTGKEITEMCETTLKEDGNIPPKCVFSPDVGFRCEFDIGDEGIARFLEKPTASKGTNGIYYPNDTLEVSSRIEVIMPEESQGAPGLIAQYVTKNQNGKVVHTRNVPLDKGSRSYNEYPGFKIESSMFGASATDSITLVPYAANGAQLVSGSKVASPDAETTKFIVAFTGEGATRRYSCYGVSGATGAEKFGTLITSQGGEFTDNVPIVCNKVQFRLNNVASLTSKVPSNGEEIAKFGGSAIYVIYTRPAQPSFECTSEPATWKTEVTLYNTAKDITETGDASSTNRPANPVYADGKVQKEEVSYKVACRSVFGEVAQDYTINAFSLTPETDISQTQKIS
ncbi:MAG TPA: hypothetical protein VKE88_00745, partial [Candidatus Nanoarchaeia archaeon]|nr:hypothetical protein [Candidatus Nanoarchaeia archaeon]